MPACQDNEAAAERDRANGIVTIRRLDGSSERVKTRPIALETMTVVRPNRVEQLPATAPAARVFEVFLGLLANGPEWLRAEERSRYSVLFRELARFAVETHDHSDYAETLSVRDLPRAASQWLDSLSREDDPLLLSFGLDAVEFFFELVTGRHRYGERPELEPIVDIRPPLEHRGFFSDNRSMRKLYTERVLHHLPVLARVPENSGIRRTDGALLIAPGEAFGVEIVRCHLSENPPYEFTHLNVDWPQLKPFDRASEFSFRSTLLVARTPAGDLVPWAPETTKALHEAGPLLDIPAHWISARLDLHEDPLGQHPTPIRTWTVRSVALNASDKPRPHRDSDGAPPTG